MIRHYLLNLLGSYHVQIFLDKNCAFFIQTTSVVYVTFRFLTSIYCLLVNKSSLHGAKLKCNVKVITSELHNMVYR